MKRGHASDRFVSASSVCKVNSSKAEMNLASIGRNACIACEPSHGFRTPQRHVGAYSHGGISEHAGQDMTWNGVPNASHASTSRPDDDAS